MTLESLFITKYKPYSIEDFCIDKTFVQVLNALIEIDYLNILFIGDVSSGKTTLLYALIRKYYQLDKHANLPENNILFVNNLKEQGIQYFRNEMKTFCQSRSAIHGKKKLVIVDDIDTINEQCQQVFRNYIDKYKNNIHFISVCSNIQKVIESIQSRMHIIKIKPQTDEQITIMMERIIQAENIIIDNESKQYLLFMSQSSIRVLINYLEKMYLYGEPITLDLCKRICSNISFQYFEEYVRKLRDRDLSGAVLVLNNVHDYGYSVIDILDYFFAFVKITTMFDETEKYKIIPYLCKYITLFHNLHEDSIELALFTNNLYGILICEST